MPLTGRRLLLGVSGSIAAFKAAALASILTKQGAEVRTILTSGAERFVTRETFAGLTTECYTSLWDADGSERGDHLDLAAWAEVVVIAPASANTIARMSLGLADDLLTTTLLATHAPVLVCPAMESSMFDHPSTQGHLSTLKTRGVRFAGPATGHLASGASGVGRMVEPEAIVMAVEEILGTTQQDFDGVSMLITAGPTREAIDPVRFIANRSSGKMGYSLAVAAERRGAKVTLISGPVDAGLRLGRGRAIRVIDVESAAEMAAATLGEAEHAEVVIMAAAIADYRPSQPAPSKIKKSTSNVSLDLEPTEDVLKLLGERRPEAIRIGFAAETDNLEVEAERKLRAKGLAMIVANRVEQQDGSVFGSDSNQVTILLAGTSGRVSAIRLPPLSKVQVAERILDCVAELLSPSEQTQ